MYRPYNKIRLENLGAKRLKNIFQRACNMKILASKKKR
jgi:hypothetical protein